MEPTATKVRYTFTIPKDMWRYSTMGRVEIKFPQGVIEFDTEDTYFISGPLTMTLEGEIAKP